MVRLNTIIAGFLFFFTFLIYIKGVSPSVYGGDSGDVILAAWFGGVAHPPGYPLNTMLGWIFTHLPYSATVAFKADIMAAFLHALVIGVFYLSLQTITKNIYVSFISALVLAFVPLYWLYAHILEVFQLNLLLISVSVYFLFKWRDSVLVKKENISLLYLAIFFAGLAVFHNHTSALLFPAYLYLIFTTKRKLLSGLNLPKMILVFFLGSLPYLFIPFAAAAKTPINWDDPVTIKNFIRLITRADYGTFTASDFILGSTFQQKYAQLVNLFLFVKSDFSWFGLFILVGLFRMYTKYRQLFWFSSLAFIFCGPFFLVYPGFPFPNNFYIGLWERFLLATYFFLTIFIAFGLLLVFEFFVNVLSRKLQPRGLRKITVSLLVMILPTIMIFYLISSNNHKTDLSQFRLGDWLGADILASATSNSIVLVFGDTSVFNTQYIYYTGSRLEGIKLIKGGSLYDKGYREQVAREYPSLIIPENFSSDTTRDSVRFVVSLVTQNYDSFDIYTRDFAPEIKGFKWSNSGLLKKLVKAETYDDRDIKSINDEILSKFLFDADESDKTYEHYMSAHIKEIYSSSFVDIADELLSKEQDEAALEYLNKATFITPYSKKAYIRLGNTYFGMSNCEASKDAFEKVASLDKKDWQALEALSKLHGECFKDQTGEEFYRQKAEELKANLRGHQF